MITPIPFKPRRFRSAAEHYLQGRPAYAPGLIQDVATLCRLDGTGSLLDLGCGPGQLARGFRPYVEDAVGMDPEPEMLAIATRLAAEEGSDISFREGSSQDLRPGLGPFRLVTIGRAFHWMDRVETARRLDAILTPDGALVLFHTTHARVPVNAWRDEFDRVVEAALAGGERNTWRGPDWVRHEGILLDSPLSDLHQVAVFERREIPGASLIDRALSMSSSSRERLGEAGEQRLRAGLEKLVAEVSVDGKVSEVIESTALIARRP